MKFRLRHLETWTKIGYSGERYFEPSIKINQLEGSAIFVFFCTTIIQATELIWHALHNSCTHSFDEGL